MKNTDKALLRQKMLEQRVALTPDEVREKSRRTSARLFELPQYQQAKVLLLYIPYKNEIDTFPIIQKGWQDGKKIAVPVCQPKKRLLLSELHSLDELKPSKFGLYEPADEYLRPVLPENLDLAILPGVAFDLNGYRLGYGGGYFDLFFNNVRPVCFKIALAYEFQILEKLPVEKHDIWVDIILTENNSRYINNK